MKMQLSDIVSNPWRIRRRKPYTALGVARKMCIRCKTKKARYQWQICSDGNHYRPLCAECDIGLNKVVLNFMNHPEADNLVEEYERQQEGNA